MYKLFQIAIILSFFSIATYGQAPEFCLTKTSSLTAFGQDLIDGFNSNRVETRSDSMIYLKTVVHVLNTTPTPTIPEVYIENLIDDLNLMFSSELADTSLIVPIHQDKITDSKIRFCLAKVDPNGELTNGIVNKFTNVQWFDLSDTSTIEALKFDASGGSEAWDVDQYFNIWIAPMVDAATSSNYGVPKESYLPLAPFLVGAYENLTHDLIHGVVVDQNNYLTPSPFAPFVSILAHECGHALGLLHTFGPVAEGANLPDCENDDLIADTPLCSFAFDCLASGAENTCIDSLYDEPDNVSNFMNYSCMQMFTPEQITVMRNNLESDPDAATQSSPCKELSSVFEVDNLNDKKLLRIYPNPNDGNFTIEFLKEIRQLSYLKIFDLQGQLLLNESLILKESNRIELSQLSLKSGLYILMIELEDSMYFEKVFIQTHN